MALFGKRKVEEVIDLRDSVDASEPSTTQKPSFEFGFPTRCPSCGGVGYLDHIDPFRRVQFEHCPSCLSKWQQSEEEVLALNA